MPMDRLTHSSSSSDSSRFSSSTSSSPAAVLSIECLKGSSRADEWTGDMLQTGDIVEELRIGNTIVKSPFKNGKSGVQRVLHTSYKQKETSIRVRVRRGSDEFAELQACIVPGDQFVGRKQYVLRAIDDPNYAVGFCDRTESECFNLQGQFSKLFSGVDFSFTWEILKQSSLNVNNNTHTNKQSKYEINWFEFQQFFRSHCTKLKFTQCILTRIPRHNKHTIHVEKPFSSLWLCLIVF